MKTKKQQIIDALHNACDWQAPKSDWAYCSLHGVSAYLDNQYDYCNISKVLDDLKLKKIKQYAEINGNYKAYLFYLLPPFVDYNKVKQVQDTIGTNINMPAIVITSDDADDNYAGKRKTKMIKCVETGKIYHSQTEAQNKTGIRQSNISYAIMHNTKTHGLTFVYIDQIV